MNQRLPALWRRPHRFPEFRADDVHVWCAALDQLRTPDDHDIRWLSPIERDRAERFRSAQDRRRFVCRRRLLRLILCRYLETQPDRLELTLGARGKLGCSQSGRVSIRFNISHSNGIALFAFARHREVGVDVEFARSIADVESLAAQALAPGDSAALRRAACEDRLSLFYRAWTRYEALEKATGRGLHSRPVEVLSKPANRTSADILDDQDGRRWSICDLAPVAGFAAALAVEGTGSRVSCWSFGEVVGLTPSSTSNLREDDAGPCLFI